MSTKTPSSIISDEHIATLEAIVTVLRDDPAVLVTDPRFAPLVALIASYGGRVPTTATASSSSSSPTPPHHVDPAPATTTAAAPTSSSFSSEKVVADGDGDDGDESSSLPIGAPAEEAAAAAGFSVPAPTPLPVFEHSDADKWSAETKFALCPNGSDSADEAQLERAQAAKDQSMQFFEEGNFDKAISKMTMALTIAPSRTMWWAWRAEFHLRARRPMNAVKDACQALERNPDSVRARRVRGLALWHMQRYDESAKDLNIAQQIDFDPELERVQKSVNAWVQLKAMETAKARAAKSSTASAAVPPRAASGGGDDDDRYDDMMDEEDEEDGYD